MPPSTSGRMPDATAKEDAFFTRLGNPLVVNAELMRLLEKKQDSHEQQKSS